MKYQPKTRHTMKHAKVRKQDIIRLRIASCILLVYTFIHKNWKRQTTRVLTFTLAVVMATVSTGEYIAPFVRTVVERNALKEGLVKQTFVLTPSDDKTTGDYSEVADITETSDTSETDELQEQPDFVEPTEREINVDKVTLKGWMPEGATATAVDVTEAINQETTDGRVVAAYDISIYDGNTKFQPNALLPIKVEIEAPGIVKNKNTELWHINDNGEITKVSDFKIRDGKIQFEADSFSVYSVVEVGTQGALDYIYVQNISEVTVLSGGEPQGFYLSYLDSGNKRRFLTNEVHSTNKVLYENPDPKLGGNFEPALWYFEQDGSYYKVYTLKNNTKYYITMPSKANYSASGYAGYIGLTSNSSDTKIVLFDISVANSANHTFKFKVSDQDFWLQHSNGGGGIRYWTDANNAANSSIYIAYPPSAVTDDELELNGKTYGLMNHNGGTLGYAIMASDDDDNAFKMKTLLVRHNNESVSVDAYFVAEDTDITMWTFESISSDKYYLKTTDSGVDKYLKIGDDGLSLVEGTGEASQITVRSDSHKKIRLSAGGKSITLVTLSSDEQYFTAAATSTDGVGQWFNIVEKDSLSETDYVTYYATKISVSEPASVPKPNKEKVLVYTRVWNVNRYDMYAIDSDGSLYPVYERGDDIVWVGGQIDTLAWEFTEYRENGKPTNYYELYNPYSKKYLAPQLNNNQIVSNEKIGLNLTGRMHGEYYSDILAWDDPHYAYVGLQANTNLGTLEPVISTKSDTFYFATIIGVQDGLTKVDTVDNNEHGITLKMIDFPTMYSGANGSGPGTANSQNGVFNYQNHFLGGSKDNGSKITTGILSKILYDKDGNYDPTGYPNVTATDGMTGQNLGILYNGTDDGSAYSDYNNSAYSDYKPDNRTVNHLFLKSTYEQSGYFEYDSSQNFATLVKSTGTGDNLTYYIDDDFTVYEDLASMSLNSDDIYYRRTRRHSQFSPYNYIDDRSYPLHNDANLYSMDADNVNGTYSADHPPKGILPETDPRKYERMFLLKEPTGEGINATNYYNSERSNGNYSNYYNGMEMTATMTQSANGKDAWDNPIIFEFQGDDDFWFYVDGVLVLDLGGIHSALSGSVNFSEGTVIENGKQKSNLYRIFYDAYKEANPSASESEIKAWVDAKGLNENGSFKAYSTHTIRVFYMERGAGSSNLHMRFNLNNVKPGDVALTKQITGEGSNNLDKNLVEYPYQIWYKIAGEEGEYLLKNPDEEHIKVSYLNSKHRVTFLSTYTPPLSDEVYENVYMISPGKTAQIHFPDNIYEYKIVECGVNTEVYDVVKINDTVVSGVYEDDTVTHKKKKYSTSEIDPDKEWYTVTEMPSVVFENHLDDDSLHTLTVTKHLYDYNGTQLTADNDQSVFNLRLYLSNGSDDTLAPANMGKYYVTSDHNKLCRWDVSTGRFVEMEYPDRAVYPSYDDLSIEEKAVVTSQTSINGAITKIPVGYSVNYPYLLVGTKFMSEERDYEVPLGYRLIDTRDYDNDPSTPVLHGYEVVRNTAYNATYVYDDNIGRNAGWVMDQSDPATIINNERGYEIEVEKTWTDADYVKSHDPIFIAVYKKTGTDTYELIDGTVRQVLDNGYKIRYYFSELDGVASLADYEAFEVKLTGSYSVGDDGIVTGNPDVEQIIDQFSNIWTVPNMINGSPNDSNTRKSFNYQALYDNSGELVSTSGNLQNVRYETITNIRQGGVVVSLYNMKSWANPVTGNTPVDWNSLNASDFHDTYTDLEKNKITTDYGEFVLKEGNNTVGTFKSGRNGTITILYDFLPDVEYTLKQIKVPTGFYGLEKDVKFTISGSDDSVTFADTNAVKWRYGHSLGEDVSNLVAYVDVFNMPFTLDVLNTQQQRNQEISDHDAVRYLANVKYELYDTVSSLSGPVKNTKPMEGYENIESSDGTDGLPRGGTPLVNNTLRPGTYYLHETWPCPGYLAFEDNIVFVIPDSPATALTVTPGEIGSDEDIDTTGANGDMYPGRAKVILSDSSTEYEAKYTVTIEHRLIDLRPPILYIYNNVEGTFGDKTKVFTYQIHIKNESENPNSYFWYYNGKVKGELENDGYITLRDGEYYIIGTDDGKKVTVTLTPTSTQVPYNLTVDKKTGYQYDEVPVEIIAPTDNAYTFELDNTTTAYTYTVNLRNRFDTIVPVGLFDISFVPYLIPLLIIIVVYVVILVKKRRDDGDDE